MARRRSTFATSRLDEHRGAQVFDCLVVHLCRGSQVRGGGAVSVSPYPRRSRVKPRTRRGRRRCESLVRFRRAEPVSPREVSPVISSFQRRHHVRIWSPSVLEVVDLFMPRAMYDHSSFLRPP